MEERKNNEAIIVGKIVSNFSFNHQQFGERFYRANITVKRLSGVSDTIPFVISEHLIHSDVNYLDQTVKLVGQFCSHNYYKRKERRVKLFLLVEELSFLNSEERINTTNKLFLDGVLCKKPVYRKTPLGREITDLLLAVNNSGKSDYIPCIVWGRNARYVTDFKVGKHFSIWGRIQSREYTKKYGSEEKKKIVYEVSVNKLEESNKES